MAEEIHFEIGHFRFDGTLTLTSDDLESHIVENDLSVTLIADGRTYVRPSVRPSVHNQS